MGNTPLSTVADVWFRAQTSNAIEDLVNSSNSAGKVWSSSSSSGESIQKMYGRLVGHLSRPGHLYRDTEQIFRELASKVRMEDRISHWLSNQAYIPESIFYCMLGRPDNLHVIGADWAAKQLSLFQARWTNSFGHD
jgi:hypothetical protein